MAIYDPAALRGRWVVAALDTSRGISRDEKEGVPRHPPQASVRSSAGVIAVTAARARYGDGLGGQRPTIAYVPGVARLVAMTAIEPRRAGASSRRLGNMEPAINRRGGGVTFLVRLAARLHAGRFQARALGAW